MASRDECGPVKVVQKLEIFHTLTEHGQQVR